MNSTNRQQLRLSLLRFLDENPTRFGLELGLLHQRARGEGRPWLTAGDVDAELLYLEDKGFCAQVERQLSPELRAWRATSAGRDFLAMASA